MHSKETSYPRHPLWKESPSEAQETSEKDVSNQTAPPETDAQIRIADWRARNKRASRKP